MQLSHLIERFLLSQPITTVRAISRQFRISEQRCREELASIRPFGVEVTPEGKILARTEQLVHPRFSKG